MLSQKISDDLKEAMKAKEEQVVSTLRMLNAAFKNKRIEVRKELEEADAIAVIKKEVKALEDSVTSFVAGKREDLVEKAKKEIAILKRYLPAEMDDGSLEMVVKEAIAEVGATTKAEMGKVMGVVIRNIAGAADGKRVKTMVEKLLG